MSFWDNGAANTQHVSIQRHTFSIARPEIMIITLNLLWGFI